MYKRLAVVALAITTTMAFGQAKKTNTDIYKVNQSGAQKITNGPVIEYRSDHSAMVGWSTKDPAGTYIAYGTDRNSLNKRTEKSWGGTNHRLEIKNLQPSTTYYFQVRSEDAKGSKAMGADVQSGVESFQTVAKGAAPDKANRNVGVQGTTAKK
jgi:Purple acid Phosphatase, N-terminal domain